MYAFNAIGAATLTDKQLALADLNADGVIDSTDAYLILVGLEG